MATAGSGTWGAPVGAGPQALTGGARLLPPSEQAGAAAREPFRSMSGLTEAVVPLYPAALVSQAGRGGIENGCIRCRSTQREYGKILA